MESLVVAESVSSRRCRKFSSGIAEDDTVCVLTMVLEYSSTAAENHHAVVALVRGYSCRAAGSTRASTRARYLYNE